MTSPSGVPLKYVILNNRDEMYNRRTQSPRLHAQVDGSQLWCSMDLEKGGTWFSVSSRGRFAVVTNVLSSSGTPFSMMGDGSASAFIQSRGSLVSDFVNGDIAAKCYGDQLASCLSSFRPFAIAYGDLDHVFYFSSVTKFAVQMEPGFHAFSNSGFLDDHSWKRVDFLFQAFPKFLRRSCIDTPSLFKMLETRYAPTEAPYKDSPFVENEFKWFGVNAGTRTALVALVGCNMSEFFWKEYDQHSTVMNTGRDCLMFGN